MGKLGGFLQIERHGVPQRDPVERVVPTRTGLGYWVVQQNGTATAFGNATAANPPADNSA